MCFIELILRGKELLQFSSLAEKLCGGFLRWVSELFVLDWSRHTDSLFSYDF